MAVQRVLEKRLGKFFLALLLVVTGGHLFGNESKTDHAELQNSRLFAIVVDNGPWQEHHARYNGLAFLSMGKSYENVFHLNYGGFDLENIFDQEQEQPAVAPQDQNFLFEPRNIPMQLQRLSADTVELRQEPGPHWGVETQTRFTLHEPYYIDVQFECIPRQKLARGNFLGLFFADYVNSPRAGSFYFLGCSKPGSKVEWVRAYSQKHNDHSTFLPDHSSVKTEFRPGYGSWLWSNFSKSRYSYPFFYGIVKGQMLMLMFDHKESIRFAHSPTGGGGTPAWDFQFIIPSYQVGKKYGFHARILVKKFVSREDVIREYERWSGKRVLNAVRK